MCTPSFQVRDTLSIVPVSNSNSDKPQLAFGFAVAVHTPLARHAILTYTINTHAIENNSGAQLRRVRRPLRPLLRMMRVFEYMRAAAREGGEGGDVHAISDGDDGGAGEGAGPGRGGTGGRDAAGRAGRYFARRR